MEKKMETNTTVYIGASIRIHSFIPKYPKASNAEFGALCWQAARNRMW